MSKNPKTRISLITKLLLFLLMAAISVVGFQLVTRNIMKEDLLGKNPICSLPCWINITPGITHSDEAVKILQETAYIDKGSIKQSGTDDFGGCTWNWKVSGRRTLPMLGWQNGVVREISLGLTFNFTLDEVLNEFGPPEAVGFIEGGTPENWYWVVDMFYPQTGIQLKVYTPNFSSVIEPSTEVGVVVLFSPSSLENRVSELFPDSSSGSMYRIYRSWKGYGDIKQLYEGNEK